MNNLSIRSKIILAFSGIYLLMNLLLLLLNQIFLDDYFIANNLNVMERHVTEVASSLNPLEYDVKAIGDNLKMKTGGTVFVLKSDLTYGSLPPDLEDQLLDVIVHYSHLFSDAEGSGEAVKSVIGDGPYMNRKILFIQVLPTGEVVVIIKALGLIMEAQEAFITFLAESGAVVYGVSIVLIVFYANRFTKPIKEAEQAALDISYLNFAKHLDETRNDEIGSLNKHINRMALKLDTTIEVLNDSNEQLLVELNKERNMEAMREQFVSDVSHELKNPISMIMGYAEGIKRGLAKTEEDKIFYNKVILEEGERMNKLVEELLDLSSYRSGSTRLNKEMVQISEMVSKSLGKYTMVKKEKNLTVSLDLDDEVLINADPIRFSQVINNLLDNAFKYTNIGGRIKVILTNDTGPLLTVSNTGKLIPEDEYEHIWHSFYQIDSGNEGSGIGLAIVKSIVELHHYRINGYPTSDMNNFSIKF